MKAVEASATTREQAIQNALEELGVEMYQVDKIEILDEGSRGLFGFGARPVKVKVVVENLPDEPRRKAARPQEQPREHAPEPREERDRPRPPHQNRGRDRQDRPDRPARQDRGDNAGGTAVQDRGDQRRAPKHAPAPENAPQRERSGERGPERGRERGPACGNERGRGPERGRERTPDRSRERNAEPVREQNAEATPEQSAERPPSPRGQGRQRPPRGERDRDRDNRPRRPQREERPARPATPEGVDPEAAETAGEAAAATQETRRREEESFAPISDEQGQQAAGILQEIINRMGIQAQVSFGRTEDGSSRVNVASEDSAILIGRKGRTLGSLQYLVNRMISDAESENTERLMVDVEGYVDRRQASLEDMARNLAQKAKDTQRNMRLKPLSPQERRIIHLTLQDDPDVRTFSIGESLFRSVIISPKNARPERNRPSRGRGGRGGRNRRSGHGHDGEVDAGQFGD